MEKSRVYELCKISGKKHGFDPLLLLAICQQESTFDETQERLENGFYRKYSRPLKFASSTEGLFAISWGLMQVMGLSLWEDGYFKFHFALHDNDYQKFYHYDFMDPVHVCKAIDYFMANPPMQVDWGTAHLAKKLKIAKGDLHKAVLFYNGGVNPNYPAEVLEKMEILRLEFA